ncbi:uncharacterized protein Gasu_21560 [Galdieria sulphuraria]|uniref:Uncharacterized protein n=1 Tax=Galdieria sulphuraria TaxID=130081 RepID=M2XK28_GALSU|nr:uncharacterized protein Gasu_21560 [Galdieria sulphuraria]EME30482.1 hypothetical protein Gasu_21560 [Galdieria sulphuraria]|eukprot:XP_005707002.1 hypothetical protein Gasu_21560 [Galdieria sulphuraria]
METNKLVKSRDGNYFSCDRFRQIHERLVEERQSKLYWKTTEYSQLYGLLLRGSKPSNKVKHSLFHSKDFIAGRIVPHISLIPSDVEEEVPLYGLLRCWVYGSSVDDLYADNHNTKVAELQLPSKEDIQVSSEESFAFSPRPTKKDHSITLERSGAYTAKQLLEEHLTHWKRCRKILVQEIRTKRSRVTYSLRGRELLERILSTQRDKKGYTTDNQVM